MSLTPRPWVQDAIAQLLSAAAAGGYVVKKIKGQRYSRYLILDHPTRHSVRIRVSDHRSLTPWRNEPGKPFNAFNVRRPRTLAHVVRYLAPRQSTPPQTHQETPTDNVH